jgi:hypothetical protein
MSQAVMKSDVLPSLLYSDFSSFNELKKDAIATNNLIALYRSIFAEPDGWAENYSYREVYNNLADELSENAYLRLCVDSDNDDEVIGFCWAQLLLLEDICQAITTVQHYNMIGSPDVFTPMSRLIGNEPLIYVHDLGIKRPLRGKLPLNKMIYPVLQGVARQTGVDKVFFWTIANTNVSKLAKRAGFELLMIHTGMQFYVGTIDF